MEISIRITSFPLRGPEFATPKYALWVTDFKLVIKAQKTEKEFTPFLPKLIQIFLKKLLQEGSLSVLTLTYVN